MSARNNAEWCHLVCAEHGIGAVFGARAWTSPRRTPPYYPDAVTLVPDATAEDVLPYIDAGPGASVKDSFATLELPGWEILFEARWIHLAAPAGGETGTWRVTPHAHPDVRVLDDGRGSSSVLNLADGVVGVTNAEGPDPWPGTIAMAARLFPGRDLVGYEIDPAPALAHGFTTTGPLRIWHRSQDRRSPRSRPPAPGP